MSWFCVLLLIIISNKYAKPAHNVMSFRQTNLKLRNSSKQQS